MNIEMDTVIKVAKIATRVVTSIGVGTISKRIIQDNVPAKNNFQRVTIGAGGFAIGGVVGNAAVNHAVDTVESTIVEGVGIIKSIHKSVNTI